MPLNPTWSHHVHTNYCDGQASMDAMIQAAIEAGVTQLGVSSHAPLPFSTDWTMDIARLPAYCAEVKQRQLEYAHDIEILLGLELDYIPDADVIEFQKRRVFPAASFDYFIGSVHYLGRGGNRRPIDGTEQEFGQILRETYGGDIRLMSADYFGRIARLPELPTIKIIGHFDLIKRWNSRHTYFRGEEKWYKDHVEGALAALAGTDLTMELNTAGWLKGLGEPYPSSWILERCRDLGIPVTVSSDAHKPDEVVLGYERAMELLDSLGISPHNPLVDPTSS